MSETLACKSKNSPKYINGLITNAAPIEVTAQGLSDIAYILSERSLIYSKRCPMFVIASPPKAGEAISSCRTFR